jgi:hypothetical protein
LKLLEQLFERLQKHGYKLSLPKCRFLVRKAVFAGFQISEKGVSITDDKVRAAQLLQPPRVMSEVKSILGFLSFLRDYVPYYCDLLAPIQELLTTEGQTKGMDIKPYWTDDHQRAFEAAKRLLSNSDILAFPDSSKDYVLYTDASKKAMSAVLMQEDDNNHLHPIAYWSKSFRGSQKNWAALVKEARAVLESVQHFSVYLLGCRTILRCDHKPLARFLEARTRNEMVNRWSLLIQEFDIEFEWVSSEMNISDCLSRLGVDDLFLQHDEIDDDFPTWPKAAAGIDQSTQTEEGLVCPAAVTPRRNQKRRQATDKEEAELMGQMSRLSIKDIARLSTEQVKYLQSQDNYCKRIVNRASSFKEANGMFQVREGLLYRQYYPTHPGKERIPGLVLVIPKCLALSVVVNLHKELKHASRDKMLAALRTRVYWKKMDHHVSEFVKGCRICQFRHLSNNQYRQMRIKPPTGPGIRLAIDCWSAGGGTALTAIDLHSNYPFAEPLLNKEAKSVCDALQNILSYIRSPLEIISDNGGEFCNEMFSRLLKERNIQHIYTAPYSPQSNGVLERFHGFLNSVFKTTVNLSKEGRWWPAVRGALETYRKIPHTSSCEAPLFLFMGQEPTYNIDHLLPTLSRQAWDVDNNELDLSQLHTAHALARKNMCLARRRSKNPVKMLDKHELEVGDRVYRQNMNNTKTDLKWLPGYRIIRFESARTAVIEHSRSKVKSRVNIRHLRWADPISELILNSNIDVFPGQSKLYFTADDLEDLNWEALKDMPELDKEVKGKMDEVVRDRNADLTVQEPPNKRARTDPDSVSTKLTVNNKPNRIRKRNTRLKDYICGFAHSTNCVHRSNNIVTTCLI